MPTSGKMRVDQPLHHRHHLVAIDERHLDVDLGELGLAIGAQVLVAEAAADLHVALAAGDLRICLKSCGDCGSAKKLPRCTREGTR